MKMNEITIAAPSRAEFDRMTEAEKMRFARAFSDEHERLVKQCLDDWNEEHPAVKKVKE